MGTFTQEDPIGFAGGDNLYAYAGNNPASFTDRWGLCPETGDNLPCIPIEPIVVTAPKRDPRLDFGRLIDMSDPGPTRTGQPLTPELSGVNAQCWGARAELFGRVAMDAGLMYLYWSGAGLLAKGGLLFLEGKAISTGLILTSTMESAGATGAMEMLHGAAAMRMGALSVSTAAGTAHEAGLSIIPGKNTYNFLHNGGYDACKR